MQQFERQRNNTFYFRNDSFFFFSYSNNGTNDLCKHKNVRAIVIPTFVFVHFVCVCGGWKKRIFVDILTKFAQYTCAKQSTEEILEL